MPGFAGWPTDADLIGFLTALDLWDSALTVYVSGYVDAAVNKFQQLTGRIPFLTESTASSSFFDPPGSVSRSQYNPWRGGGKYLELDTGYTSIDQVLIGYTKDHPGNQVDINRSLRFRPSNASARGLPIEAIDFDFHVHGSQQSVLVVGKRGYSSTVPADVYNAVLQEAAASFVPSVGILVSDGVLKFQEADVSEQYDPDVLGKQADRWRSAFNDVVRRYQVIRLFV